MYYDKRIRYLSYYESDIKLQNAGYVKFQVRDSLCQMIIYVKGPRLMGSGDAAVYLLSRKQQQAESDSFYVGSRDSRLQKHLLGNLNISNGQGHCAVRMDAENMADSGLRYDEICGIRIELHEYQYLESQWNVVNFMPGRQGMQRGESAGYTLRKSRNDNQSTEKAPVEINLMVTPVSENLRVEKLAGEGQAEEIPVEEIQTEEIVTEVSEEKAYVEVRTAAEQMSVEEDISLRKKPESSEIGVSAEQMSDGEGISLKKEPMCAENRVSAEQAGNEEDVSLGERQESEVQREAVRPAESVQPPQPAEVMQSSRSEEPKQEEQAREELSMQEMLEREARREEASDTEGEIRPEEQALRTDKWEQLKKNYPIVHPIREDEEYLKIAPKDFVIFTEKYQGLVHNSFLLHGYYNYKHLILGRKERDGRVIYYLGVPGTFHDREKTVAVMFGFEAFDGKREPAENGDFGYYLRRVEI